MTSETDPTRSAATAEFGRTEPKRLPSPMFDDWRPLRFVAAARPLSLLVLSLRRRGENLLLLL